MVKSMTGFGKGICSSENVDISVEIKSINSRYFDFSPKTPKLLNNFDDELIKLVKSKCERGRITLTCTVQYNSKIDNLVWTKQILSFLETQSPFASGPR